MNPARPQPPPGATRRVFFALWPDAATASRLDGLAGRAHASLGGRRMRTDTLHMTLAFIGEVDVARIDALRAAADPLAAPPAFAMRVDQLRCWRHNRIVWCGPSVLPSALEELAAGLAERLRAAGFRLESRPFAAHATLLRKADCAAPVPAFEPFDWTVEAFVLVESDLTAAGARYAEIGRWPLGHS